MKRLLPVLPLLFAVITGACLWQGNGRPSSSNDDADEQYLGAFAKGWSQGLPRMEGPNMRLESIVLSPGKRFVFTITMLGRVQSSSAVDATVRARLFSVAKQNYCHDEATQKVLKRGASLETRYLSKDGQLITSVLLTAADCK